MVPGAGSAIPKGNEIGRNSQGGTSRKVLVIEDDPISASLLRQCLEMLGHEVETASEGQTGLAKVRDFAPDVVICDIRLPDTDGWSIARQINASASFQRPALLIALTSLERNQDIEQSREAGFDVHMVKPADLDKLRQILASLLILPYCR